MYLRIKFPIRQFIHFDTYIIIVARHTPQAFEALVEDPSGPMVPM